MAAELKVGIGADNSGLNKGLKDAEAQISAFVNKVENIAAVGEKLQGIGTKLTAGLTLPLVGLGVAAVKSYGDIQALQKGLEAVMGSAAAANGEFNKLKEVAKLPGLGMEEAVKGSINLQAIGMDAERSRNILQQFGNAVATVGKGKAEFERAIYGVQQLANTDFPLGEDLNIIKDALPQVSNLLKEAFGSSRSDELAKMGVSSQQVLDVITKGLEKLPRVTGGINGAFENMADSVKTSLGRVGAIIDKNLDISGIVDKISSGLDRLVTWFENLNPTIQSSILVVAGLAAAAGPLLVVVGGLMAALPAVIEGFGILSLAVTKAGGAMGLLLNPITLVTAGIIGIVAAVAANWNKITPYLVRTANNFIQLYNESQTFRGGVLSIGFAFESLYAVIKSFAISAYNTLKSFGKGVLNLFEGISEMARGFSRGLNNGDWSMFQNGWTKANEKVALSFDNMGARIDAVESKYNKLLRNDKVKFVTEADLNISTDKSTTKAAQQVASELQSKIKNTPIQVELPDIEPIASGGSAGLKNFLGEYFNTTLEFENRTREFTSVLDRNLGLVPKIINEQALEWQLAIQSMNDTISEAWSNIMTSGVANGIADAAGAIGEAMASGDNVIAALGKSLLSTVGDIAIQLGKAAISVGVGMIAIKAAFKNPVTAIAAGVALVALGSFIKGTVAKIPQGGGSGSNFGSNDVGGGNSSYSSSYSSGGGSGTIELIARVSGTDLLLVTDRAREKNSRLNSGK